MISFKKRKTVRERSYQNISVFPEIFIWLHKYVRMNVSKRKQLQCKKDYLQCVIVKNVCKSLL